MKVFLAIAALAGFAASFVSFSYCLEPEQLSVIGGLFFGLLFWSLSTVVSIRLIQGATVTLLMVSLCSCTGYMHEARSVAGNYERDILVKWGGTASQRGADGSSFVTDDQTSFRDLTTAAVGIQGSISGANISASNNALKAKQAAEETTRAKNAADAANRALELKNQGQVIQDGTGVLNNGQVLR